MASTERPRRPTPLGGRGAVLLAIAAAGLVSFWALGLGPAGLVPRAGGARIARDFFAAALAPALEYEAGWVPPGAPPFLLSVAAALWRTVVFATAGVSLSLVLGLALGVLSSDAWWSHEAFGGGRLARVARPLQVAMRVTIALMRSVHELLWGVVFLAAVGLNTGGAVLAIAIPYSGTLAKVFSEMLDEAPRDSSRALRTLGGRPLVTFLFGLFPRALPDLAAYAFYRFECGLRASAVLGFFGYPTLGYYLRLAFEDLHYREVWTYLYAMLLAVLVLEAWSAALRRRFVS